MNKIQELLVFEQKKRQGLIKETANNSVRFERNCRNTYWVDILNNVIENIYLHNSFLGKKVYKYKFRFSYITLDDWNKHFEFEKHLNPITEVDGVFVREMLHQFTADYINNLIDYYTKELIENQLVSNSTNKLSNLIFEWELDEKQQLIKFLKSII
jgi:hypothetical protein